MQYQPLIRKKNFQPICPASRLREYLKPSRVAMSCIANRSPVVSRRADSPLSEVLSGAAPIAGDAFNARAVAGRKYSIIRLSFVAVFYQDTFGVCVFSLALLWLRGCGDTFPQLIPMVGEQPDIVFEILCMTE